MNTDLVPVESPFVIDANNGLIIDRQTGQAVTLAEAEASVLSRLDEALRAQRDFARHALTVVEEEIKSRMGAARSLDTGAHLIEVERKREWDKTATWEALTGLVAAGLIAERDADAACPEKTERKPDGRKLNALLGDLVARDPVAASPLARARSESSYLKIKAIAVEGGVAND